MCKLKISKAKRKTCKIQIKCRKRRNIEIQYDFRGDNLIFPLHSMKLKRSSDLYVLCYLSQHYEHKYEYMIQSSESNSANKTQQYIYKIMHKCISFRIKQLELKGNTHIISLYCMHSFAFSFFFLFRIAFEFVMHMLSFTALQS